MRELAAGLALAAALNAGIPRAVPQRPLPQPRAETAVETASLLSLGMRRLAADLELIRLLVYYGTPEEKQSEADFENGRGVYPELGPRVRRILELDPSFSYAVLYGAGALAFNLDRPQEALAVLEDALKRQPDNDQYRAYVGAIAFHRSGDMSRALALLEPTLAAPDCPTMIKHLVAYMYRRAGRRADAVRLYREIRATSRDAGYRANAERALRDMGAAP